MWKFVSLLFLPLLLISQDLEVRLSTQANLTPVYLGKIHPQFEELRSVLEFDLNASGFCATLPTRYDLENSFASSEKFNFLLWRKEKIPFCFSLNVAQNRLELTAYNIEKGTLKKYPSVALERQAIHKLADMLQKDLFGKEGIASLKLIYTNRTKNQTAKGLEWLSEIWVCDADGENARQITTEKSYCLSPYFISPNSDEFFYVSEKSGQSKIYKASLSKPKGELLIDLKGNQALPSFSKKGLQMAFITDVAGRPDLFLQAFNSKGAVIGKARQLFSAPRATQATPTFSPDGKQIAFVSDKDGPPRIYVMNVGTPKDIKQPRPRLLTKKNRENTSPSWSFDGTKLAYSAKVDGVRQIWIYDFLTDQETQLTRGAENKENPSWAPDSFHLVYNTESEESCELYLIHLNQCEPIRINNKTGQKRFASWELRN
jgi:TolB protein